MLQISDLNTIIKHYSFNLPQRFEELNKLTPSYPFEQEQQHLEVRSIIDKFQGYRTTDQREIRLAKKLVQRVLHVFQFFRAKSGNQNLLALIQKRIEEELAAAISGKGIMLGELFSYVHLIAKKGGLVRVPAQNRRVSAKSLVREPLKIDTKVPMPGKGHSRSQVSTVKYVKSVSLPCEKWKAQDLLRGPFGCLDVQRHCFSRIREGNQHTYLRDMLRRNEKILASVRRQQKKMRVQTEASEDPRQQANQTILSEIRPNSIRGSSWMLKKRKQAGVKRRQGTMKENISVLV